MKRMTNEEFQETANVNLREVIVLLERGVCDLISYGLAPNPNGFCYEKHGTLTESDEKELNTLLDGLTPDQERELIALYM